MTRTVARRIRFVSALAGLIQSLQTGRPLARLRTMSTAPGSRYAEALSATWLAARMAVDPAYIDAMRRAGELLAVRYPAWQFDHGTPRTSIARIVAIARSRGIDEAKLYAVLTCPLGLRNNDRNLVDLLQEGRDDEVVAAVRAAG